MAESSIQNIKMKTILINAECLCSFLGKNKEKWASRNLAWKLCWMTVCSAHSFCLCKASSPLGHVLNTVSIFTASIRMRCSTQYECRRNQANYPDRGLYFFAFFPFGWVVDAAQPQCGRSPTHCAGTVLKLSFASCNTSRLPRFTNFSCFFRSFFCV